MILGIDHIALSAGAVDEGIGSLAKLGYRSVFIGRNLRNALEKSPFLTRTQPFHDIAYCQADSGIAIELTAHGEGSSADDCPYSVVFCGDIADADLQHLKSDATNEKYRDAAMEAFEQDVSPIVLPYFNARAYYLKETGRSFCIKSILLDCADLEIATSFYNKLGFTTVKENLGSDRRWRLLAMKSIVAAWTASLLLVEFNTTRDLYKLDMPGFTCVALLSNNIHNDALPHAGASRIFPFTVGGKSLELCMIPGPSGECVELIQVQGKKG